MLLQLKHDVEQHQFRGRAQKLEFSELDYIGIYRNPHGASMSSFAQTEQPKGEFTIKVARRQADCIIRHFSSSFA